MYLELVMSLTFFVLAAIFNALMDTLADAPHFNNSIFQELDSDFWLKTDSWDNKYNDIDGDGEGDVSGGLIYKGALGWMNNFRDAWHIAKMGMIFSFAFSVLLFPSPFEFYILNNIYLDGVFWLCILGVCWNFPFNLFYKHIFVRKSKHI